jgi:magnesium transporter
VTGETAGVRTIAWRKGGELERDFPLEIVSDRLAEEGTLVWVDLCNPTREALGELADELSFDWHAVEDATASTERPKATQHATHTFATFYATRLDTAPDPTRRALESRLVVSQISTFVLARGMVTVRRDDEFDMDTVVSRWQERADLLELGPSALLHGLLDVVVDGHFDTIQALDDAIESLEDELFDERGNVRDLQQRTYRLRKEIVELRRVVLPMREVVNTVMRHHGQVGELDGWYADLYDHVVRASEWTESLRDMVTTVFETNLALQDARLNVVMKKLTGWAAIIAVPTAVTGWFGMNVAYPGINEVSGFVASTLVISTLGVLLYVVFKRQSWI